MNVHMRLRPTMSASQSKRSWPNRVPIGVASLTPRSRFAERALGKEPDGFELMIIIICTFGQVLSGEAPAINIIGAIIVWRFFVSLYCLCRTDAQIDDRWVSELMEITRFLQSSRQNSLRQSFVAVS